MSRTPTSLIDGAGRAARGLTDIEQALGDLVDKVVSDAEREGSRGGEHLHSAFLAQGLYDIPFMQDPDVRTFTTWGSLVSAAARVPEAAAQIHSAGPVATLVGSMSGPAAERVAELITEGRPLGLWLGVLPEPEPESTGEPDAGYVDLVGLRHGVSGPGDAEDFVLAEPSQDGRHVHLVTVNITRDDVTSRAMARFGSVSQTQLTLSGAAPRPDSVIGLVDAESPGGTTASGAFTQLELLLCFELVGLMQTALTRTVAHARTRQQFGSALGSFQAVQHMLADMAAATAVGRATLYAAAEKVVTGDPTARFDASVAKVMCSTAAVRVCESAIQLHGGIGFTREARLDSLLVRARYAARAMGGADWHRKWLTRHHEGVGV